MSDKTQHSLDDLSEKILGVIETSLKLEEFDLHTADRDACILYRALQRLYVQRASDLIKMIEDNGDSLREQLQSILRDC